MINTRQCCRRLFLPVFIVLMTACSGDENPPSTPEPQIPETYEIVFSSNREQPEALYKTDEDGSTIQRLTPVQNYAAASQSVSADGEHIYYNLEYARGSSFRV